ncbi:CASTOR/POLLUX-related putative ion channel [Streptomyces genisteinicus]|uniref:CASTOR/POLLUX-related putative ion channel n=1 Tax=Streptomyces genisteinicus TaxID=2768068 RepID=UPI001FECF5EB|nr:NAD-binding lipoprotein [Streptomyces genisteinicus]
MRGAVEARVRYWFDTTLARGTAALVGWLALACLVVVVPVSALLVWTDRGAPVATGSKIAAVWRSTGQTMRLGGEVGPPLRVALSVLLALVALFYVSTLVSLITAGITDRLIALRRGHSTVLERGHTVVLGWSEQTHTVVAELVAAQGGRRPGIVAVLADRDPAEMEEELRSGIGCTGRVRLVVRSGRPTDPAALARVSPATAGSVLVLPRDDPAGDAEVVKTLLSLRAVVGEDRDLPVVAAVRDDRCLAAARLAGGPGATVLEIDDVSARLLVQCARRPGLSLVHRELLDFAGDEFHTVREPALAGRTFREAAAACPVSSAVGVAHADGGLTLGPPAALRLADGDELVVIARDREATRPAPVAAPYDPTAVAGERPHRAPAPRRLVLLGWNRRAGRIVEQLARATPPGSSLEVVTERRAATVAALRAAGRRAGGGLEVVLREGDPTLRETVDGLDLAGCHGVIVIGPDRPPGLDDPDDRTLVTLLHLRARERATGTRVHVVTELTDDRNRLIAPVPPGADVVVSGTLTGLLMTQISQNPRLAAVFEELTGPGGSTIRLLPAGDLVRTGLPVSFATVVEAASRRGACAIGYRSAARAGQAPGHGVRINPPKVYARVWEDADQVIVLAPEESAPAAPVHAAGADSV